MLTQEGILEIVWSVSPLVILWTPLALPCLGVWLGCIKIKCTNKFNNEIDVNWEHFTQTCLKKVDSIFTLSNNINVATSPNISLHIIFLAIRFLRVKEAIGGS